MLIRLPLNPPLQRVNKGQIEQKQPRNTRLGKEPPEFGPETVNSKGFP
jgi:hypothetical protein